MDNSNYKEVLDGYQKEHKDLFLEGQKDTFLTTIYSTLLGL